MLRAIEKIGAGLSPALLKHLTPFLMRHSTVILVVAIAITIVGVFLALRIQLNTNLIALLPEDTSSVKNLKHILAKTEGTGDLMVMIESPDSEQSIVYAKALLPRIVRIVEFSPELISSPQTRPQGVAVCSRLEVGEPPHILTPAQR